MSTDREPGPDLARARNLLQAGVALAERLGDLAREVTTLADDAQRWLAAVVGDPRQTPPDGDA